MKKSIFAFVIVFLFQSLASASGAEPTVPLSWMELPEDGGVHYVSEPTEENPEKLVKLVDKIFSAQGEALVQSPTEPIPQYQPYNKPKDWVPWRFVTFASDLTVSAQGVLGMLTFKGTPGVSVYWQKREQFPKQLVTEPLADFAINETTTPEQLDRQIDVMEKTIVASGRIKKTPRLRENLDHLVHQFASIAGSLGAQPLKGEWYPSRLRVDLQISASGDVSWGTVGGDLRVRLEWFRIQTKQIPPPLRFQASAKTEESLRGLVGAMSEDLAALSEKSPSPDFEARVFRVGLGIGLDETIGVAKASEKAFGHVYFSRIAKTKILLAPDQPTSFSNDSWYLVDTEKTLASPADAMFKIDRARFRRGLQKAMTIGSFFTRRAKANDKKTWAISVIKPEFTMSVTGELGLVKMTGLATAQIEFQNINF